MSILIQLRRSPSCGNEMRCKKTHDDEVHPSVHLFKCSTCPRGSFKVEEMFDLHVELCKIPPGSTCQICDRIVEGATHFVLRPWLCSLSEIRFLWAVSFILQMGVCEGGYLLTALL